MVLNSWAFPVDQNKRSCRGLGTLPTNWVSLSMMMKAFTFLTIEDKEAAFTKSFTFLTIEDKCLVAPELLASDSPKCTIVNELFC